MAEVVEGVDEEFEKELDAAGSGRGKLRRKLKQQDPRLAELYEEQTPAQKAWGRLIGKLILSRSNDEVEAAFDWMRDQADDKVELTNTQKAVALFHAVGSLGVDAAHYRILRRMYIKANTNE
jgi:hypothetical protein